MSFKSWILGVAVSAMSVIAAPAAFANPIPVYIDGQVGITQQATGEPVAYCRAETALPSGIATTRNTPEPLEAIIQSPPNDGQVKDSERPISIAYAPGLQIPVSMMGIRLPQGVNATVGGNPFNGEVGAQLSIQIVGSNAQPMKISGGADNSFKDCLPLMVQRYRIERSMKLRESRIKSVIEQTKRDGLFSKIDSGNEVKQREILDSLFRPKHTQ